MTRQRYEQITRYLHINDRETEIPKGQDGHDRLAKVRPLVDHLSVKFPQHKLPFEHQTIDEVIILSSVNLVWGHGCSLRFVWASSISSWFFYEYLHFTSWQALHRFKGNSVYVQFMKDKPVQTRIEVFLQVFFWSTMSIIYCIIIKCECFQHCLFWLFCICFHYLIQVEMTRTVATCRWVFCVSVWVWGCQILAPSMLTLKLRHIKFTPQQQFEMYLGKAWHDSSEVHKGGGSTWNFIESNWYLRNTTCAP